MAYDVTALEVEPKTLLVAKGQTTFAELPATIGGLLGEIWDYVKKEGIAAGLNVVLYPGTTNLCADTGGPIEAGVEFAGLSGEQNLSDNEDEQVLILPGGLSFSSTPGGRVASATHWGSYSGLGGAHEAIHVFCKENGHVLEGTSWEVYGHWFDDPSKVRTDVFYLLQ